MSTLDIKTIDVHQLKKLLEQDSKLRLIDVREPEEWQELHIPWATHIPKDSIVSAITARFPEKNLPIYLHCKAGVRSLYAAQYLINLGYEEVYSVNGGIMDWAISGYPIITQQSVEEYA